MFNHILLLDIDGHLTAEGTIALAALTVIAIVVQIIYNQKVIRMGKESSKEQLDAISTQLNAQNENSYKYTSVKLVLAFDEQFEDMVETRAKAAEIIIDNNILERGPLKPGEMNNRMDDIYDLYDTIGFFIKNKYIKAEVAHEYFHHWFSRYYTFYEQYKVKESSGYEQAAWNNLLYLSKELYRIEDNQTGAFAKPPTKDDLIRFFNDEKDLLND
jgi:hypothetical protein